MKKTILYSALTGAILFVPVAAQAQSVTRASVDVTLGGGYSNNPYGGVSGGGDTGAAYGQATIAPRVSMTTEHSLFTFDGSVDYKTYTSKFRDNDNYRAALGYQGQPNERLKTRARASYVNAFVGAYDQFDTGVIGEIPPAPDVGLFGAASRRSDIDTSAGLTYQISERSSVSLDGRAGFVRYSQSSIANEYNDYGGTLSYSRQLKEHLSIGLMVGAAHTNYLKSTSDTDVYNAAVTLAAQLSPRWSIEANTGAARLETNGAPSRTAWTADASLCYKSGDRSDLCLRGARQFSPTGYSGTRIQTLASLSYSHRLTERDSITANASYSRVSGGSLIGGPVVSANDWYWRADLGYTRRQTERLSLSARALYRKVHSVAAPRDDDYGGSLSLTYRFGDLI